MVILREISSIANNVCLSFAVAFVGFPMALTFIKPNRAVGNLTVTEHGQAAGQS